jgi:hypothetical protein
MGYDTQRSTGQKVSCAACGHSRNHFHGFVVEFQDGSIALVGIECGERYFGAGAWAKLVAGLEHAKRAALYSARSAPAVAKVGTILPRLEAWAAAAEPLEGFLDELEEEFPALVGQLAKAAKGGGSLTREVLIRAQRQDARGSGSERTEFQLRRFGSLPAGELFLSGGIDVDINQASRLLLQAKAALEAEEPTLATQQSAFGLINRAFGMLQDAHRKHSDGRRLFSEELWVTIAKWGNADGGRRGNYRCRRRRFWWSEGDDILGEIAIPPAEAVGPSPWPEIAEDWPKL